MELERGRGGGSMRGWRLIEGWVGSLNLVDTSGREEEKCFIHLGTFPVIDYTTTVVALPGRRKFMCQSY